MSSTLRFLKTELPHRLLALTIIYLQFVKFCEYLQIVEPPTLETPNCGGSDEADGRGRQTMVDGRSNQNMVDGQGKQTIVDGSYVFFN